MRDAVRHLFVAHAALDDTRRPCGTPLPLPHAWALLELRAAGPMSVTALAERLHIDRTNVSRLCARMESLDELARTPDPEDARAWRVHLTTRGARAADAVDATSAAHFAGILARLDDSRAVLDALNALARAMSPDSETER